MELKLGYKQTEVGPIPENWCICRFMDQFKITAGGDVNPKLSSAEQDNVHPFPIYSNTLFAQGLYGYCSYADHPAASITITARGTLGVATYRDHKYTAVGRVLVLEPKEKSDGRFFASFINSRVRFAIESTGVPQLTAPQVGTYPLAVPPVSEQRAIATALSDVDALLGGLARLIAKKCDLRQAVMQQLLTGRTRLPGFYGEWQPKRLGDIGTFLKGTGVSRDQARSGALPCIRYGELYTQHHEVVRSFGSWISRKVSETATRLRSGDILFAGSGETKNEIGKCAAFVDDLEAYAGGDIIILRPFEADSTFLGYCLNSAPVARQKASRGQGDAVVHISAASLSTISIPLPLVPEQTAIATVLSDMEAEIAGLERRRAKTRDLKQAMMQELLTGRTRLV
jgi:type I restriction enzyme, S subunit